MGINVSAEIRQVWNIRNRDTKRQNTVNTERVVCQLYKVCLKPFNYEQKQHITSPCGTERQRREGNLVNIVTDIKTSILLWNSLRCNISPCSNRYAWLRTKIWVWLNGRWSGRSFLRRQWIWISWSHTSDRENVYYKCRFCRKMKGTEDSAEQTANGRVSVNY